MGWAGLSMVCHGAPLEAVRLSCAGTPGCSGVDDTPTDTEQGGKSYPAHVNGATVALTVQPCERLEASFLADHILPAFIPAAVAIVGAKFILRQFSNHA